MVGRIISPRCANCRLRKIRCDLATPECSQCIKSKWQCPGYDAHARFHAYKDRSSRSSNEAVSGSIDLPESSTTLVAMRGRNSNLFLKTNPNSTTSRLQNEFIFKITHSTIAARFVVIPEKQLLSHIPKRVGHSSALDDAIRCICSASPNEQGHSKDTNGSVAPGRLYSRALRSLNRALSDTQESQASETLAAAILLQMYEHSVDHTELRWVIHANGVIKMLKLRGPENMQNELDLSILGAEVGNIFSNAIRDRSDCFLASPDWAPIIQDALLAPVNKQQLMSPDFSAMILAGLGVPGIIRRYEQFQLMIRGPTVAFNCDYLSGGINTDLLNLTAELHSLRHLLIEWRELYEIKFIQSSSNNSSLTESSIRIWHASRLSVSSFLLMADFMLMDLAFQEDGIEEVVGVTSMGQSRVLAHTIRSAYDALRRADTIAAAQTSTLLRMMLGRVLDASPFNATYTNPLRSCLDGTFDHLKGNS